MRRRGQRVPRFFELDAAGCSDLAQDRFENNSLPGNQPFKTQIPCIFPNQTAAPNLESHPILRYFPPAPALVQLFAFPTEVRLMRASGKVCRPSRSCRMASSLRVHKQLLAATTPRGSIQDGDRVPSSQLQSTKQIFGTWTDSTP